MEMYNFDYFYGNEAEQYQFYMIPQLLFTDKKFKKISTDAKVLYSLLLDRTGLSFANKDRFTDDDGKTYIYFTRDTAMEMLGCGKEKSAAIFKELSDIGLIERKRQGLGKPDKIYVKHFDRVLEKSEKRQEVGKADFQRSEKPTSESRKNQPLEVGKNEPLEVGKNEPLEVGKTDTNQTNISHTDVIKTQSVIQSAKSETASTKSDGQTDRLKEPMTFSQVLSEIGIDTDEIGFVPKSENDLQELDESDRSTNKCTIPYSLKTNKKAMKEALKFLFAYSYYAQTMPDESKRLLCTVIIVIAEMTEKDTQEYQGQTIKYYEVIDRLNDIIQGSDGSLFDWFNSFELQWAKILAEHTIKHQKAYMKSCIWNWLNDYAFEDDNDLRTLNYNFKQGVI